MKTALLFVALYLLVAVSQAQKDNIVRGSPDRSQFEEALVRKLNTKCTQKDFSSCVMLKLVTYMNRMLKKAAIQVGDDVEITQSSPVSEEIVGKNEEDYSRSGDKSEDEQVTQLLLNKMWTFVKTRSLRWRMFDDADLVISNTPDADGSVNLGMSIQAAETNENGARGKMKNLAPILAAAAMKIGLLGGLAFKGLALLVGKALLVSKIALLLASIIGLKKLFSQQKHVTYEVVSHPHHSHESVGHEGGSSGWGRDLGSAPSEVDPHVLAYGQQVPQQSAEDQIPQQSQPEPVQA